MNPNPILVALWSVIVWVIIGNSIAPLIPPPSSYSFSDEDDPLLIGFNVLETAPPATHFAMVILVIVSLVGIVPTSIQHVKTIHPDLYHDLYFVRRAISGFCVGSVISMITIILIGASPFSNLVSTSILSCLFSALVVVAPSIVFGLRMEEWRRTFILFDFHNRVESMFVLSSYSAISCSWCSCVMLVMDWDYPIQTYPVPNVIAAIGAFTIAITILSIHSVLSVPESNRKRL